MKKRFLTALVVLTGMLLLSASIVWAQSAPVARTGQITVFVPGDNGYYNQTGVASPSPRFTDNGDGTVTDNLTGLMWAKDANLAGGTTWFAAIDYANNLSLGTSCGVEYTDWRLPNIKELQSMIDFGNYDPALPTDNHFANVQSTFYWSSTTENFIVDYAWFVSMYSGYVSTGDKFNNNYYVWPVRGGN